MKIILPDVLVRELLDCFVNLWLLCEPRLFRTGLFSFGKPLFDFRQTVVRSTTVSHPIRQR